MTCSCKICVIPLHTHSPPTPNELFAEHYAPVYGLCSIVSLIQGHKVNPSWCQLTVLAQKENTQEI